jgi:hypothetical protein
MKKVLRYTLIGIVSILAAGTAAFLLVWIGVAMGLIK